MRTLLKVAVCGLLVVAVSGLWGCLPQRVLIDLSPNPTALEKSVLERGRVLGPQVAVIGVEGVISENGGSSVPGFGGGGLSVVDRVVLRLRAAERDDRVKAVVLRVNSPGGTVAGSEVLYDEVVRFRAESGKPVVVSMGGLATSGGYYVALAGDEIFAQRSTMTGSIGVLIQTFNVSGGMGMIGVEGRAVTSAGNKDIANPFEPSEEGHYAILQRIVDGFYASFVETVRAQRGDRLRETDVDVFDGRVMTGEDALAFGLIDAVGGVRDAASRAEALAGIEDAALVAWHAPGRQPASIFAGASGGVEAEAAGAGVAGALEGLPDARAYYIWRPAVGRQ